MRRFGTTLLALVLGAVALTMVFATVSVYAEEVNGHGFRAWFPIKPKYTTQEIVTLEGFKVVVHTHVADMIGRAYLVNVVEFDSSVIVDGKAGVQKALDNAALKFPNGRFDKVEWSEYQGLIAADAFIALGHTERRAFTVAYRNNAFIILYGGPRGTAYDPDTEQFIKSLEVIK